MVTGNSLGSSIHRVSSTQGASRRTVGEVCRAARNVCHGARVGAVIRIVHLNRRIDDVDVRVTGVLLGVLRTL